MDNQCQSSWQRVEYGVPQGCVLSPLLFLVFINDLATTIRQDPGCNLLRPLLFADDGSLVPNPKASLTPQNTYNKRYLVQLKHALTLLDRWCLDSRMEFGRDKTQLMLCTGGRKLTADPYTNLQLCGFTIGITQQYTYLGVVFWWKMLSWKTHYDYALKRARAAAARVTAVALQATSPSLKAIRALVLGYVLPTFMYGCLFWARKLGERESIALQACVTRPLRAALDLPQTTHQLNVLHLCAVPTIESLVLKAELSHARRVSQLHATHPTAQLHEHCLSRAGGKDPHVALMPEYTLSTALHLATNTLPMAFHEPSLLNCISAKARAALRDDVALPPLSAQEYHLGAHLWNKEVWGAGGRTQRQWSQANYKKEALRRALDWAPKAARRLTPPSIRELARWKPVLQWRAQHVGAQATEHVTTAPLTQCKPGPALAPYLWHDDKIQAVRRSRLLTGRAYTQVARCRFAGKDKPAPASTACTYTGCVPSNPMVATPEDTVEHILLRCRRHDDAREQLRAQLRPLFAPPPSTAPLPPLTMSTILCAAEQTAPFRRAHRQPLMRYTNDFLLRITVERGKDSTLAPFDNG